MRAALLAILLHAFTSAAYSQTYISEIKRIGDRTQIVWYDRYSNKSVIAEFADFLAVIEFPQVDSLSNELITRLGKEFPKKPIRYVLHSHHHSHSISAFDPFLQRTKARLVTTRYNLEQVKGLTKDTARLMREAIVYQGSYTIKDRTNELRLMEMRQSEYNVPTPEYNVFLFPKQSSMVTGCLYNKPEAYHEVVNDRKKALDLFLKDKRIAPSSLIPTNTSRSNGFMDICSRATFDSTLAMGIDPVRFMESMHSRKVEYLLASKDSLKAEFSKIPRSYDYIVCANYLIAYGDPLRAIAMLRPLAELYPTESVIPYFTGVCYENMGMKTEAVAHYRRQLALLKDEDEMDEVRKRIASLEK
jgi:hypothetical protein